MEMGQNALGGLFLSSKVQEIYTSTKIKSNIEEERQCYGKFPVVLEFCSVSSDAGGGERKHKIRAGKFPCRLKKRSKLFRKKESAVCFPPLPCASSQLTQGPSNSPSPCIYISLLTGALGLENWGCECVTQTPDTNSHQVSSSHMRENVLSECVSARLTKE